MSQESPDTSRQQAPRWTKQVDPGAVSSNGPDLPAEAQASQTSTDTPAAGEAGQEVRRSCPECASLRAQVQELRQSRDEALLALGREREFLDAMRLKYSAAEYHPTAEEPPLRYVLADKVNNAIKGRLGFLHTGAKKATAFILRLTDIWN